MSKKSFPDFELPATSDLTFKLSDQRGHPLVVYFYPKDNTPGCTTEGQQFPRSVPAVPEAQVRGVRRVARQPQVA